MPRLIINFQLFSRFGKVLKVIVKKERQAFVIFNDIISALYAQKSLNGHYIKDLNLHLSVDWCNSIEEDDITPAQVEELLNTKLGTQDIIDLWNKDNSKEQQKSMPNLPPGMPVNSSCVKLTCRHFLISQSSLPVNMKFKSRMIENFRLLAKSLDLK